MRRTNWLVEMPFSLGFILYLLACVVVSLCVTSALGETFRQIVEAFKGK